MHECPRRKLTVDYHQVVPGGIINHVTRILPPHGGAYFMEDPRSRDGKHLISLLTGTETEIPVFTTRQDTVFGATFMCLAPEHPLVTELARGKPHEKEVSRFIDRMSLQDRSSRAVETHEKEGVFTGAYCTNPLSGGRMPIFTANFALMEYGTGAVMSVPAHDQRDFEFARKYNLDIVVVVNPFDTQLEADAMAESYTGEGVMVNSGQFNGMKSKEALNCMTYMKIQKSRIIWLRNYPRLPR